MKRTLPLIILFSLLILGALAQQQSITLPVGTQIAISTIDRINSKKADSRHEYAATLDDPVIIDGVTVIPAKTSAFLRVSDIQSAGYSRRASMSTSLVAVMINGQRVEVNTDKLDSQSGSQVKRTVAGTAVGAGTGAAIGGALGGGAGAGIGAGVGAAGGAVAGKIFGKAVEIAPETRFTYTLTQSVVIDSQGAAAPQARLQPPPEPVAAVVPDPPTSVASQPDLIGAVYFQDQTGTLLSLEQNRGIERRRGRGNAQETYWEMAGASSQVRFKSGQKMTFVVRLANGIDPKSFKLYPLESKNENRRTTPMTLSFNVTKVGDSTYGLTPVPDLAAGEYAFSPKNSDEAYCFGIDPAR